MSGTSETPSGEAHTEMTTRTVARKIKEKAHHQGGGCLRVVRFSSTKHRPEPRMSKLEYRETTQQPGKFNGPQSAESRSPYWKAIWLRNQCRDRTTEHRVEIWWLNSGMMEKLTPSVRTLCNASADRRTNRNPGKWTSSALDGVNEWWCAIFIVTWGSVACHKIRICGWEPSGSANPNGTA